MEEPDRKSYILAMKEDRTFGDMYTLVWPSFRMSVSGFPAMYKGLWTMGWLWQTGT